VVAWRGNREAYECERRKETRVSMWRHGEETESVSGGLEEEETITNKGCNKGCYV